MTRDWKPGDVAMVDLGDGEETFAVVRNHKDDNGRPVFVFAAHHFYKAIGVDNPALIRSARPLVVIDPEDREQVEQLARAWSDQIGNFDTVVERMVNCLRSLIAPPRPDEPTGLGAVVEDADGERWIRRDADRPWVNAQAKSFPVEWCGVNAVRVLSEGVPA